MKRMVTVIALGCAMLLCGGGIAAETPWFDGVIGGTATGGSWTDPLPDGVELTADRYVLDEPEGAFAFTATEAKEAGVYTNLIVRTTARFGSVYEDCTPELSAEQKMAIAVCSSGGAAATYRAYDGEKWIDTKVTAKLDEDVAVVVTVTRDGQGTKVELAFGNATYGPIPVVSGGEIKHVGYAGSGEVAALTGAYQENWIPPPGKTIPPEAQDAVEAWAKRNGVRVDQFASDERGVTSGRTKYESCMLNIAPDEPLVARADGTKAGAALGVAVQPPLDGAGSKVGYRLLENGAQKAENATGAFEVTLGEGRAVYSVQALVDGAAAGNPSSKVGAQSVAVAAGGSYLPVPWTDWLGQDAKVTDLVKPSALKANDQIDVYDAASGTWTSCQYDGEKWVAANGAAIPTLRRGQAFRFSGTAGTLYLIGGADAAEVASTDVEPGKFTLVAKPDGTAFSLSKLGASDKAMVMERTTGLPTATYVSFHGAWVKKTTGGAAEDAAEIPANTGFFLKTSADKVNW